MSQTRLTRREILYSSAGLAVAGLAGCSGVSGGSGGDTAGESSGDTSGASGDPAGHGESEHGHQTVSEPKESREVLVNTARGPETTEYHYKPHVTWVSVGGTVTWRLESGTHTATAYHPDNEQPRLVPEGTEGWASGTLSEQGATYQHTFETEGVYHYYCEPHEQFGMLATVIVGKPDPDEQVALQSIPGDKPEEVGAKLRSLNGMVRSALGGDHHEEESGDHHDGTPTESDHHEEESGDHHESTATESDHHEEESGDHHESTATESDHHEEESGDHHESNETSSQ